MSKTYTALDPVGLGRFVIGLTIVQIGSEMLQILASAYAMSPAGAAALDTAVTTGEVAVGLSAILCLALYLLTAFFALKWIYRVNRNAHAFARGLPISPAWAVGWFFVPFATLWKPYEAMSDAWRASERPNGWKRAPRWPLLPWWWGAWLFGNFAGYITSIVTRGMDDVRVAAPAMIIGAALALPADVLFIALVRRLSRLQSTQIHFGVFDEAAGDPEPGPAVFTGAVGVGGT